jgi:tetratricopeptide (TPR) repeat protein
MEWFARSHDDLLAVMRQAAAQQCNTIVWRLFQAMWPFYSSHVLLQAWRDAANLAVAAARADGDAAVEARMLCLRARGSLEVGDFPAAGTDLDLAAQLSRAENGPLLASVLDFTGQYRYRQGRFADALAAFEASLAINERLGDRRGIALQAQFCGRCLGRLGHGAQALAAFDRASRLIAPFDDARAASRIAYSRAEVLISLGADAEAVASLHDALDSAAGLGQTMLLARPLESLADIAGRLGDRRTERRYVEQVVTLHRRGGSPELGLWQQRLEELSR